MVGLDTIGKEELDAVFCLNSLVYFMIICIASIHDTIW